MTLSNSGKFRLKQLHGGLVRMLFALLLITCGGWAQSAFAGTLRGKIVDSQTGEPLMFVSVVVTGTTKGAATDLDGVFVIRDVPAGTYEVSVTMVGYSKRLVTGVVVPEGDAEPLNLTLTPEVIMGEEIEVTAESIKNNNEAALLRERQKASSVSDAISQENMSRSGSSTAADAMEKVTGVSVEDGKYFYVRGLGDRYTNARLNGATLASSDPDRNSVSMDMFPSNFLESIVTSKTFTPDQPGDFTGGSVNIRTTTFPEKLNVKFSMSASRNDAAPRDDKFLTYPGGVTDWMAKDDGTRAIPDELEDPGNIPTIGTTFRDSSKAYTLDHLSRTFNPNMGPSTRTVPGYHSEALSIGNQSFVFGKPLGYFASFSYNRSLSSYREGTTATYYVAGQVDTKSEMESKIRLKDYRSTEEVLWGGMANLSFKPHPAHNLHATYNYNRRGESSSRYQVGVYPHSLADGTFFETRTLSYLERTLQALQTGGDHRLKSWFNVDWTASYTNSKQDEPDLRYFSNSFTPNPNDPADTTYDISQSNYTLPTRYYRDLDEDIYDGLLNTTLPFNQWGGLKSSLKLGGSLSHKMRTFRERRFTYEHSGDANSRYDGDWYSYFTDDVGVVRVDTALNGNRFYTFGQYITESSSAAANYDGDQDIYAAYAMVDLPVTSRLRVITGARYEVTRMHVESQDKNKGVGQLHNNDVLPSVNAVYALRDNMNARAAYTRTLARPTFRELAPYSTFDFVGDGLFSGNPDLKRTLVDNYDLRLEWFVRPGELLALSGFYKDFQDPIERAIIQNENNEGQFQNVPSARVTGIEFEARTRLDHVASSLRNFQIGGNLTLLRSEVQVPPTELGDRRSYDPDAPDTRQLQGQSPYLINLDAGFNSSRTGTSINLFYNVFGERMSEVATAGSPHIFEQPRGLLDFGLSQNLWRGLSVGVQAKNLLDASLKKTQEFKGQQYVVTEYKLGRTVKMGFTYNL